MSLPNELLNKVAANQSIAYSLIRIFLGIILLIRGIMFIIEPGAVSALEGDGQLQAFSVIIAVTHLIGGLLMTIGLFTRIGALIQLPILFSAVFIVHARNGLMYEGESLEVASLVFFMLLVFLIFGSGRLALGNYLRLSQ